MSDMLTTQLQETGEASDIQLRYLLTAAENLGLERFLIERLGPRLWRLSTVAASANCPYCDKPLIDVRKWVSGVCLEHGVRSTQVRE